MNLPKFFGELKRRNVYKVAAAYAVATNPGSIAVQPLADGNTLLFTGDALTKATIVFRWMVVDNAAESR